MEGFRRGTVTIGNALELLIAWVTQIHTVHSLMIILSVDTLNSNKT